VKWAQCDKTQTREL